MSTTQHTSPPGGTGPNGGLGETFSINLGTGTAMHAYRLPLPDGVAKHTPSLALEYAHGTGLGAYGLGWRLGLRAITAGLDLGTPSDDGLALRLLDGGTEIVPTSDGTFRAMRETSFARYTRVGDGWRIEERTGAVHELGPTPETRVAVPGHPERVVEWLLSRSEDVSGNAIDYTYLHDDGYAYPQTIGYATYAVRFAYEPRPDVRHDGRSGLSRHRRLRGSTITLVLDPGPTERVLRTWDLRYDLAPGSQVSLLASVGVTSHGTDPAGALDVVRPLVSFGYTPYEPTQLVASLMASDAAPPPSLTDPDVALVTLDDAPLPGVLVNRDGHEIYWRNDGAGRWAVPEPLRRAPLTRTFARAGLAFVDMDGSGTADLMVTATDAAPGYFANAGADGWGAFVAFPRRNGVTPTWSDPSLRLVDADADGLVDAVVGRRGALVWWRNGGRGGWSAPQLVPTGADLADVDLASPDVHLADMTGDGVPDLVRVRSGRVEYWPGLGRGRYGDRVVMQGSPRIARTGSGSTVLLLDVDGDGCADLVVVAGDTVSVVQNQNGTGFAVPVVLTGVPVPIAGTVRALNLSGAATAGLVWNTRGRGGTSHYVQWRYAPSTPAYLLEQVDNGSGLVSRLSYRSAVEDRRRDRAAGKTWTTTFPFPYVVVAGSSEVDAVSGRRTEVAFRYHEAHFEARSRQFQGFRSVERLTTGDASRATTREVHTFLMAQERLPGHGPGHAALNGLMARIETYAEDGSPLAGRPFRVEECEHDLTVLDTLPDGRERAYVVATVHRVSDSERGDDVRTEERRYVHDAVGNVVREVRRGSGVRDGVAVAERVETREMTYAVAAGRHLLDKPSRTTLRDGDGALVTEQRFYYDGPDFVGLPLGQADRGLLSREEELALTAADFDAHYAGLDAAALGYTRGTDVDGRPAVFATARRSRYDVRGLSTGSLDPLGHATTVGYDDAGLFRLTLTEPLGTATFAYDRANGQITASTHVDGSVTRFAYDAQGRVLATALPGQDLASAPTTYRYDESVVPHRRTARMLQADGTSADGVTYFDGAGQEHQQRVTVSVGRFLVSGGRRVNPWGDVAAEFEPTFAATLDFSETLAAPGEPERTFAYDALGRVTRCVNYNGGVSEVEHSPFVVTTHDANDTDGSAENRARGQFDTPHREEMDVFRTVVRVADQVAAGDAATTTYAVGTQGELLRIDDERGTTLAYGYDRRGCRLTIESREAGTRRVFYDAAKQPVRTLDGDGHDIRATWDDAGRLAGLTSDGTAIETYTYDTAAQHAQGRLARVTYVGGAQEFAYDAAGHLLERRYHFDGEPVALTLGYGYDPLGRLTSVEHTDGTRQERTLTANGWLAGIPGVLDHVEHDPRGLPTELAYANGVRTTVAYTPGPGRVSRQTTTSASGVVLEDVRYGYDLTETLLTSDDTAPGGAGPRDFAYDPLGQLSATTAVEVGAPVERHYAYVGRRNLARLDEAASTLHYDDAVHLDRLTGITVDGRPRVDVDHDAGGNLLTLPGMTFAYNVKNELTRLRTDAGLVADYAYDHLGMRATKRVDDGQEPVHLTHYVGDQAVVRDGVASVVVTVGGQRCAVITGADVVFVHDSPTGSSSFFTDASGERVGALIYDPYGHEASRSGEVDLHTYSLHPVDAESGLVYMRRRYYAPAIGRFLTPDLMALFQPEKFVHAPAGLHLYAYVANDPMNKTDEDGLSFWSVVGAVVGVVAGIAVGVLVVAAMVATGGVAGLLVGLAYALLASLVVTGVSYIVASNVNPSGGVGQFLRGFMIGFNAGMNATIATSLFGVPIGVAIGVVNGLAAFDGVARNPVYQGVLGWSSWLMPQSWVATGLGVGIYLVNLVASGVSSSDATKIDKLGVDWKTGTLVMSGGWLRGPTAFDMGNFVFMNPSYVDGSSADRTYDAVLRHETGHTLAVAAFGTAFGAADLLGENVFKAGANDYGEQIAESHANRPGRPTIPMWG